MGKLSTTVPHPDLTSSQSAYIFFMENEAKEFVFFNFYSGFLLFEVFVLVCFYFIWTVGGQSVFAG